MEPIKFESQAEFDTAVGKAMALNASVLEGILDKALKPITEKQAVTMQGMLEAAQKAPSTLPKGHVFARTVRAMAIAHIERKDASKDPEFVKSIAVKYFGASDPVVKSIEDAAKLKATAIQASDPASLGNMIAPVYAKEFIELLRNRAIIRRISRVIPNPTGQITFGKQTLSGTAYWVGEGKPITASKPATANLNFTRKKMGVLYVVSNDMLRYGGSDVDALILDDMLKVAALAEDVSFLRGDGTVFAPSGLASLVLAAQTYAQTGVTLATADADFTKAKRLMEEANLGIASDDDLHWLMVPRTFWALWNLAASTDTGARPYRDELKIGRLLGANVQKTNQIPKNLGGGSNASETYLVHGPDLWIADTLNNQVDIFPGGAYYDGSVVVSGISNDETVIRLLHETDFNVRYQEAIVQITGVTLGA